MIVLTLKCRLGFFSLSTPTLFPFSTLSPPVLRTARLTRQNTLVGPGPAPRRKLVDDNACYDYSRYG